MSNGTNTTSTTTGNTAPAPAADNSGGPVADAPAAPKANATTQPADAAPADPALVQARADLDAAIARMKDSLRKDPDYLAALNDKQASQTQIAALRSKGDDSPEQILPLAQRGLEAGQQIARIERDASAKDPDVVSARANLAAAITAHNAAQGGAAAQGTVNIPGPAASAK